MSKSEPPFRCKLHRLETGFTHTNTEHQHEIALVRSYGIVLLQNVNLFKDSTKVLSGRLTLGHRQVA